MTAILAFGLALVLALLSVAIVAATAGDIACLIHGHLDVRRVGPWSAYRCGRCGKVAADLDDFGL